MAKKKLLIVFNPFSGRKSGERIARKLQNYLSSNSEVMIIGEDTPDGMLISLRNHLPDADLVLGIGGDGLMNLMIQEMVGSKAPFCIYPAGTGNDFHRHNFNKFEKRDFSLNILGWKEKFIDLALTRTSGGKRYYGQVLSAGFDSIVNRRANRLRYLPGSLKYILALLIELPSFRPLPYEISIDGEKRNLDAMMVVIGNGPTYGGGMKVLPAADSQDGELDLLILHPVSKLELLRVFPKVFTGGHVFHPKVELLKGKEIEINTSAPIYADGEYFGDGWCHIKIAPRILRLLETK